MKATNSTRPEGHVDMTFSVSYILVMLPLSVCLLCSGLLRWRQKPSTISHSDFFTYNMALMELVGVSGQVLESVFKEQEVSFVLSTFPWYAETVFPVYTSVEQYLAAVYPVTYLGLKRGRGLWLRHAGAALVWLLCVTKVTLMMQNTDERVKMLFASDVVEVAALLLVMVFCSASVLHVLRRPKPGRRSGADRPKQRAFFLLLCVTLVLVFRFTWDMGYTAGCMLPQLEKAPQCLVLQRVVRWVHLVTSLVTPLMYLQRARKLG